MKLLMTSLVQQMKENRKITSVHIMPYCVSPSFSLPFAPQYHETEHNDMKRLVASSPPTMNP